MSEKCAACLYFIPYSEQDRETGNGSCRRYPTDPGTYGDRWCGEWEAKEEVGLKMNDIEGEHIPPCASCGHEMGYTDSWVIFGSGRCLCRACYDVVREGGTGGCGA